VSRSPFWHCNVCNAQNHETDGECQYCECLGAACKRDNCDGPEHPGNADPDTCEHEASTDKSYHRGGFPYTYCVHCGTDLTLEVDPS
jgi:hypothetical protein